MQYTKWQNQRTSIRIVVAVLLAGFLPADLEIKSASADTQAYSFWSSSLNSISPTIPADPDTQPVELGMKFSSDVPGKVSAIRFYRTVPIDSGYVIHLWDEQGNLLGNGMLSEGQQPTPGWQTVQLYPPVSTEAGKTYIASYYANGGEYPVNENFFQTQGNSAVAVDDTNTSVRNGPLYALCDRELVNNEYKCRNGLYKYGSSGFPTESYKSSNYWIDVIFKPD